MSLMFLLIGLLSASIPVDEVYLRGVYATAHLQQTAVMIGAPSRNPATEVWLWHWPSQTFRQVPQDIIGADMWFVVALPKSKQYYLIPRAQDKGWLLSEDLTLSLRAFTRPAKHHVVNLLPLHKPAGNKIAFLTLQEKKALVFRPAYLQQDGVIKMLPVSFNEDRVVRLAPLPDGAGFLLWDRSSAAVYQLDTDFKKTGLIYPPKEEIPDYKGLEDAIRALGAVPFRGRMSSGIAFENRIYLNEWLHHDQNGRLLDKKMLIINPLVFQAGEIKTIAVQVLSRSGGKELYFDPEETNFGVRESRGLLQ